MVPVLYLLLVYLVAAVPFGLVLTTLYGGDVDVRTAGSGNIGATNVARLYGWRLAGPALVLDLLKGLVPVLVAPWVLSAGAWWPALVGGVAFIGHCWPVYLEFRGGKGVATGAGVMLAIAPVPTLCAAVLWGLVLAVTGRSSVAALTATVGLVGFAAWLRPGVLAVAVLLALAVAARHLANIRRLVRGEESQVVRPVRWNRHTDTLSTEEVLAQGPAGTEASVPLWHEPIEDPLEAEAEAAESPTG